MEINSGIIGLIFNIILTKRHENIAQPHNRIDGLTHSSMQ